MMNEHESLWMFTAVLIGVGSLFAPDGYDSGLFIIALIIGCNITGMMLQRYLSQKENRRDDLD
jgi:Na+(H+)/acetate symporter ActP